MDFDTWYFEVYLDSEQEVPEGDLIELYHDYLASQADEYRKYLKEQGPVTPEDRRAQGDDMLNPTYNLFGEWEND